MQRIPTRVFVTAAVVALGVTGGLAYARVVEERDRVAGDLSYLIPLDPATGGSIELGARHEGKDLTYKDVELPEGGETRIETNIGSVYWHLPERKLGNFDLRSGLGLSFVGETYDVFEVLFGNLPDHVQDVIIDNIGSNECICVAHYPA